MHLNRNWEGGVLNGNNLKLFPPKKGGLPQLRTTAVKVCIIPDNVYFLLKEAWLSRERPNMAQGRDAVRGFYCS